MNCVHGAMAYRCRPCRNAYSKQWRKDNPEYIAPGYLALHDTTYLTETRCCKNCGVEFQPTQHNQLHCTIACKRVFAAARYEPTRTVRKRTSERERYQISVYGHVVTPMNMTKDRYRHAREQGYRSGLEVAIAAQLKEAGVTFAYESLKIPFHQPAKERHYLADILLPNGIVVELKGRMVTADRQKHLFVKEQYPDLDVRFVFSNSRQKISKQSQTSYGKWATLKGFQFADKWVPLAWLAEAPNEKSKAVIKTLLQKKR